MSIEAKHKIRYSKRDFAYYIINWTILGLLTLIIVYPLYFLIIASISDPNLIFAGEVFFIPKGITFSGYKRLFEDASIWRGYLNTIIYTFFGTALSIVVTITAGWGLSRKNLAFKKFFMWVFIIPMFFGGGLIPFYLVVSALNMINNPLSMIIPSALSVWNVFMTKAFFESNISQSILEASRIDGAGEFTVFVRIVLPISKAIIAVMVLYYAVGQWNSYFNALIFLTKEELYPLQLILREILIVEDTGSIGGSADTIVEQAKLANQIKYASIIVSSLPIMCLYPFVQKYFNQGVMVGSIKS